jgi:nitrogen fixation-related uncharacterized protein
METFEVVTVLGGLLMGVGLSIGSIGVIFYLWSKDE